MEQPPPGAAKETVIFTNQVLQVRTRPVAAADGSAIPDYLVVSPVHCPDDLVTGAAVLATVDGRVAVLEVYRPAVDQTVLEFPRGFRDAGETPEQAARRELIEETGLRCREPLEPMGAILPESGVLRARIALFLARHCRCDKPFEQAEAGHRRLLLLDPDEMNRLVELSEIQDPATLIAWYRGRDRLGIGD